MVFKGEEILIGEYEAEQFLVWSQAWEPTLPPSLTPAWMEEHCFDSLGNLGTSTCLGERAGWGAGEPLCSQDPQLHHCPSDFLLVTSL